MIETLKAAAAHPLKACANGPDAVPQQCVQKRAIRAPGGHHDVAAGRLVKSLIGIRLNGIGERGKLDRTGDGNPEQPADFDDAVAEMPRVRDHREDIGILVRGVPGRRSQKNDTEHAITQQRMPGRYGHAMPDRNATCGVRNPGRRRSDEAGLESVVTDDAMDVLGSALRRSPAVKQIGHGRARRMGRIDQSDPGIGGGKPGAGPDGPGPRTMPPAGTSHALHGCEKNGEKATGPVGSVGRCCAPG